MTGRKLTNTSVSVRQRLLNLARQRREEFQYVLTRYCLERLLYRLSVSPHSQIFVLKGAALFQLWTHQPHRPTRDLDFLGHGDPVPERFEQLLRDVCAVAVADDGVTFDPTTVVAEQIKEDGDYQGLRLRIVACLHTARTALQLDIGFGDAVTPGTEDVTYPTLLDLPAPRLRAYPRETVVAEKYQAMVMLGIANSRMKDFYDLWTLGHSFDFSGEPLCDAVRATFRRRQTELPQSAPLALSREFADDERKQTQWRAFLRKGRLADPSLELAEVTTFLESFLMPPTRAAQNLQPFESRWGRGGPWTAAGRPETGKPGDETQTP